MPRIRTIKPQFWLDENLGAISRDARLLYIGLWNLSDDTGVFQWRPLQIKAQIFPYDTDIDGKTIEEWIELLVQIGDIERIELNGKTFGRVKSFLEHQDIKNPSKWAYLEGNGSTPALPQQGVSPTPALPLGKEEKKKGIGKEEKKRVKSSSAIFSYLLSGWKASKDDKAWCNDLLKRFPTFAQNLEAEMEKFVNYHAGKSDHKGIWKNRLLNWAAKAKDPTFRPAPKPSAKRPGAVPTSAELDAMEKKEACRT